MKTWIVMSAIAALLLAGGAQAAMDGGGRSGPMDENFMERMESMHEQMEQLRGTEDPEKRRALMQTHMESMREAMTGMRGMMMGGEMHGGPGMAAPAWGAMTGRAWGTTSAIRGLMTTSIECDIVNSKWRSAWSTWGAAWKAPPP